MHIKANFLPLESVSLIQKQTSYEIFSNGHVDQISKLITDTTLDVFHKRLNFQFLSKTFGKHLQKSMISKALKIESL